MKPIFPIGLVIALVTVLATSGLTPRQWPDNADSPTVAIRLRSEELAAALNASRWDRVARLFVSDGIWAMHDTPIMQGPSAIAAGLWRGGLGFDGIRVQRRPARVDVSGGQAIELGDLWMRHVDSVHSTTPSQGQEIGWYLTHWRLEDSTWRIATNAIALAPKRLVHRGSR